MQENAPLLTRKEAADILKVSVRSVAQYIADGDLPVVRIGGSVRFRRVAIDRFIESSETRLSAKKRSAIRGGGK